MGLFSGESVILTGAGITPLLTNKPNLIRRAILMAQFNNLPVVPTIVDTLMTGYNVNTRAFYAYGESGNYPLGLPTGHVPTATLRLTELDTILSTVHSVSTGTIIYDSVKFEIPTASEAGRYLANLTLTVDPVTGLITAGLPNMPAGYVGEPTGYFFVETEVLKTGVNILYNLYDPNDQNNTTTAEVYTIDFYDYNNSGASYYNQIAAWIYKMYVVDYQVPDGIGGYFLPITWIYGIETGIYPTLNVYDEEDLISPYFPIAPLRINGEMVGPTHSQTFYRDLTEPLGVLLSYVAIDLAAIQTALEDNPGVADIDDSYVIIGVPMGLRHDGPIAKSTKGRAILKYLYRYFTYLHDEVQTNNKAAFEASEALNSPIGPIFNIIRIRDSELVTDLYWNYIEIENLSYIAPDMGTGYTDRIGSKIYHMGGSLTSEPSATDADFYCQSELHVFYHDDINLTRTKITVSGIYITQSVYPGKTVVNTLYDSFISNAPAAKDGFYFPVAKKVLDTLSRAEQQEVSFYSIILLNYALKIEEIPWYLTGTFLTIVRIVLVVIAIYTSYYELAGLELGASEIAYLIVESIIIDLATQEAFSIIFNALVDIIGVEASAILVLIAVAAGLADITDLASLSTVMPNAIQLLALATALSDEIGVELTEELKKLKEDTIALEDEAALIQKEIDIAIESLTDISTDVDVLVQGMLRVEYPDSFFNRTNNAGIGYSALDTIDRYYDNALNLTLLGSSRS